MKKTNYNNDGLKPFFVLEDPPNYGKPNYGYEFIDKHHEKIGVALWIFILLCAIITSKAFYEYGQANDPVSTKANVTVTVTRHSDPFSGPDFNKRYEVDPKIKAAVDSMWAAEKGKRDSLKAADDSMWAAEKGKRDSLKAAEAEKRKQFVRDSILAYVHKKDSIRKELIRQDSIRLELERQKKAQIEYIAVIDDGITKRTVNVNTVSDTLTEDMTNQLGETFSTMAVEAVRERQREIDKTKDYYKRLRLPTERLL